MSTPDPSIILSAAGARSIQEFARRSGDVLVWVITRFPSDHPSEFVARPHSSRHAKPYACILLADSLEKLRGRLPAELQCFGPAPTDPPVVVETWL